MVSDRRARLHSLGEVDRVTRRELTLSRLKEAISVGQLPPGTHLAEIELSEALAVSRGTLREALRHLQQDGLVESDSRGRLSVRVVNARDIHDIFAVRAELEALAFTTICPLPNRLEIAAELRRALERLEVGGASLAERLDADLDFHAALCRLSGNKILYSVWSSLRGLARASMTAAGPDLAVSNMAYLRHLPIVELLEKGDAVAGGEFLRRHMKEASDRLLAVIEDDG